MSFYVKLCANDELKFGAKFLLFKYVEQCTNMWEIRTHCVSIAGGAIQLECTNKLNFNYQLHITGKNKKQVWNRWKLWTTHPKLETKQTKKKNHSHCSIQLYIQSIHEQRYKCMRCGILNGLGKFCGNFGHSGNSKLQTEANIASTSTMVTASKSSTEKESTTFFQHSTRIHSEWLWAIQSNGMFSDAFEIFTDGKK